jgi:hypothetical protein
MPILFDEAPHDTENCPGGPACPYRCPERIIMAKKARGRLALRFEGDFYRAYYAANETMAGAILLGSIRKRAVIDNEARKQEFMLMMQSIADILH